MTAEIILQRLEKVRKTGPNKWQACCPSHDDNHPSLSIREADDGRILIYCHALCGVDEILGVLGIDASVLFPPRSDRAGKPIRRPWNAYDALTGLAYEVTMILQIANILKSGGTLNETEHARLTLAVCRLQRGLELIDS